MFGAVTRGFRSTASLILVRNVVGELQPKRTLTASRGFLAAARLSCCMIHPCDRQTDGRAITYTCYSIYAVARKDYITRNAQNDITYFIYTSVFLYFKRRQFALMFKMREICLIDSVDNLPPEIRF